MQRRRTSNAQRQRSADALGGGPAGGRDRACRFMPNKNKCRELTMSGPPKKPIQVTHAFKSELILPITYSQSMAATLPQTKQVTSTTRARGR
jgi:hypothetical protein